MRFTPFIGALALIGCGSDASETPSDTGTPATTTDTPETTPTTSPSMGELTRVGEALVDGSYIGSERMILVGDEGYGDIVCHVEYDMTSIASRTDCINCLWAWDVEISNATSVVDTEACAAVGLTSADVAALDGQVLGYGYDADYVGHAQILMFWDGAEWSAGSYAGWDEATQLFDYDWLDGLHAY
jgi:hypothetical protein